MDFNEEIALWRYGIIASLLHPDPNGRTQNERLLELAGKTWLRPGKKPVRTCSETIRRWLYRYQAGGLRGLQEQQRVRTSSVPEKLQKELIRLKLENPCWSLALLLDSLFKTGVWNGEKPSRSALYRFSEKSGLMKKPPAPSARAFEFSAFGQLWIADFLHGPRVYVGTKKRKTYLHGIIDDASRYLVGGQFHLAENSESLVKDLKESIERFGIPRRFYTDNGAAFKTRHLKVIAGRLGFELPHSPPYRPQGRGKIERFFKTVRERFFPCCKASTLEELNICFSLWLSDEYHKRPHSSLGISPLEKRVSLENHTIPIPPCKQLDPLFYMSRQCRVYKTGTIRLQGLEFEVPGVVPGTRAEVNYLPWDLENVLYGPQWNRAVPLNRHNNALRFEGFKKGENQNG